MVRMIPRLALVMATGCFMDTAPIGGNETSGEQSGGSPTSSDEMMVSGEVSSSDPSDAGASSDASTCAPYESCFATPLGWGGPYVVALGELECPDEASDLAGTLHGDLQTEFDCGCTCDEATDTCAATLNRVVADPECTTPESMEPLPPGECRALDADRWALIATSATATGSCAASRGNTPSVSWDRHAVLCVPHEPTACDGGTCLSVLQDPFGQVCIVRDGAHVCPTDWSVGSSWFVEASDTRACECGCAAPMQVDCGLQLEVFHDRACTDFYYADTGASCHHDIDATSWSLSWMPTSMGACEPQEMLTGAVTPTAERTLCCRD